MQVGRRAPNLDSLGVGRPDDLKAKHPGVYVSGCEFFIDQSRLD